ncbi:dihydroxyacetone kinase phosphoryl donor subunit DhaM [Amycolatopsis cihanbeyliensis]|uniref:Phosphocarrier protein HPr n=1 Tax=Amycolatopsis cihanbeyliensis TaxID=1128664 RepID=A0A542DRG1_AMYCI|nr:dihydroxyacetone kinase phosphoryl donor subunit DhaM [Amycolatopsis cihanbeyliensis]TQJ05688.1 PTS hybrid protein [Amycolatopsis cihanbeyliensis]
MSVGLVLVAHSARLAEGLAELAGQMAPDVTVLPAGGLPGGGLGTDYDSVVAAVQRADSGAGVVLLYDLGSAQMTAELAVESLPEEGTAVVADAPFVEGTVAAAVAAQGGADRDRVLEAAAAAGAPADLGPAPAEPDDRETRQVELTLRNEVGLHARPAALLARGVADLDAQVRVRAGGEEVDAHSVLALMSLGARQGDRIEVLAAGRQAQEALDRISSLVERDFDE